VDNNTPRCRKGIAFTVYAVVQTYRTLVAERGQRKKEIQVHIVKLRASGIAADARSWAYINSSNVVLGSNFEPV
jgi:hypothetical protein